MRRARRLRLACAALLAVLVAPAAAGDIAWAYLDRLLEP